MNARPPAPGSPPAAQRLSTSVWRNPRVLLGVVLVLASAVAGAALLGALDDSASYWSVRADVRAGEPVRSGDLVAVKAKLGARAQAATLAADQSIRSGSVWRSGLTAGSLVPRAAVARAEAVGQQLPVSVSVGAMPADLAVGDRVDVWVGPGSNGDAQRSSSRVLSSVSVASLGPETSAAGRTVVLGLGTASADGQVVTAVAASHVTLVRVR